jgi:hypothetical protein
MKFPFLDIESLAMTSWVINASCMAIRLAASVEEFHENL